MNPLFDECGALFSPCGNYRYRLWRYWDPYKPTLCFIMLNPSTADEFKNDPTVERCERRARTMGYGGLSVVNIFAFRSTDPAGLFAVEDPIGPQNDVHIFEVARAAGMVICAWGNDGVIKDRGKIVKKALLECGLKLRHLGLTKIGQPIHPLYVKYETRPMPWGVE